MKQINTMIIMLMGVVSATAQTIDINKKAYRTGDLDPVIFLGVLLHVILKC